MNFPDPKYRCKITIIIFNTTREDHIYFLSKMLNIVCHLSCMYLWSLKVHASCQKKRTDNNFLNNADPNILSRSILAPLLKRPFMLFFDQFVVCPKLTTTVQTILMFIQSITTDDDDSQRQIRRRKQNRKCCQNTTKSRPTKLAKKICC